MSRRLSVPPAETFRRSDPRDAPSVQKICWSYFLRACLRRKRALSFGQRCVYPWPILIRGVICAALGLRLDSLNTRPHRVTERILPSRPRYRLRSGVTVTGYGRKGMCRSKGRLIAAFQMCLLLCLYNRESKRLTYPEGYDSWPRTRGCSACESERRSVL